VIVPGDVFASGNDRIGRSDAVPITASYDGDGKMFNAAECTFKKSLEIFIPVIYNRSVLKPAFGGLPNEFFGMQ